MRVWDAYLTDHDKGTLHDRPYQVWGYGKRPALVLIDLYRWVFGDRRLPLVDAIKEWPGSCGPQAWDALPHLERLLGAARGAKIPIVHVTGLHQQDSGICGWSDNPKRTRHVPSGDPTMAEKLKHRYDIVDEVAPLPGEAVIRKAAPSAFFGTLLNAHLNTLDVDGIILCGESTSGCVRATCVEGRSHRFNMTVVEECVFDRHEAPHAVNLFDMHQKYADVLSVDDVVSQLNSLAVAEKVRA